MKATLAIIFLISTSLACYPNRDQAATKDPIQHIIEEKKLLNGCEPLRIELGPNADMLVDCNWEEIEGGKEVWNFWMHTFKADPATPFTAEKLASAMNQLGKLDLSHQAAEELVPFLNKPQGIAGFKVLAEKAQDVKKVLRGNLENLRFNYELVGGGIGSFSFRRNEANDQNIWDVQSDIWEKTTTAPAFEVAAKIVRENIAQDFTDQQAGELVELFQQIEIARLYLEKKREDAGISADGWKVAKVEVSPADQAYDRFYQIRI